MIVYLIAVFGLPVVGVVTLLVMSSDCENWVKTLCFGILTGIIAGGILALGIYTGNLIVCAVAAAVAALFARAGWRGHKKNWQR